MNSSDSQTSKDSTIAFDHASLLTSKERTKIVYSHTREGGLNWGDSRAWQISYLLFSNSALTAVNARCKYTSHGNIGTDEPKSFSQERQNIFSSRVTTLLMEVLDRRRARGESLAITIWCFESSCRGALLRRPPTRRTPFTKTGSNFASALDFFTQYFCYCIFKLLTYSNCKRI